MKISTKSIIVAVAVLAVAGAVQAQETTTLPVRTGIKANVENRIEANRDIRNTTLEQRKEVRADARMEIKDMRVEARAEMKLERASSTDMFKKGGEMKKKMEAKAFEIRKAALVKELTITLSNLDTLSARIQTRIDKVEAEGRTMTEAKALLVTATEKLVKAKAEVALFASTTPVTTTASTTAEVDLAKPRAAGDAAIKAVKDARDALQKVVVAIAHNMGLGNTASTSPKAKVGTSTSSN